jgi:hypothetical protein
VTVAEAIAESADWLGRIWLATAFLKYVVAEGIKLCRR